MKTILTLLLFASCIVLPVFAGGPAAEFPSALIESVDQTPNGWTVTVSGKVRLFVADPSGDSSKVITLLAKKAVLHVPVGSQLYALRDQAAYEKRLMESVGKKELIQIWGAVTSITAGDISILRPRGAEAAFDLERLNEIATE